MPEKKEKGKVTSRENKTGKENVPVNPHSRFFFVFHVNERGGREREKEGGGGGRRRRRRKKNGNRCGASLM